VVSLGYASGSALGESSASLFWASLCEAGCFAEAPLQPWVNLTVNSSDFQRKSRLNPCSSRDKNKNIL